MYLRKTIDSRWLLMFGPDLILYRFCQVPTSLQVQKLFNQLSAQTVCWVFIKKSVWTLLNQCFHFIIIGVFVLHYTGTTFVCRENHDVLILETRQSTQTKVLLILLCNQSTPSPDEDQQYSGRNVTIHIYVTQS